MGIDPGARNIGYACTGERAKKLCGSLRYGKMVEATVIQLIYGVITEFAVIFRHPDCPKNVNIEDQPQTKTGISHAVSIRIHAVQGALFTLAVSMGKRVRCTPPTEWKKEFGWSYMGGYDANKLWSLDHCRSTFAGWFYELPQELRKSDHVCDAKLLAEQYKRVLQHERSSAAPSAPPIGPGEPDANGSARKRKLTGQEPSAEGCGEPTSGETTTQAKVARSADGECGGGERSPELALESLVQLSGFDVFETDS